MSHWIYNDKEVDEIPEGAMGFVYKITNLESWRIYIGRKNLKQRRKTKVKTKSKTALNATRSKVKVTESDWKSYIGSNKSLISEIEQIGKEKFKFEILAFLFTQGQLNYVEENIQHYLNVTLHPKFYNDAIGSRRYMNLSSDERFISAIAEVRKKCQI